MGKLDSVLEEMVAKELIKEIDIAAMVKEARPEFEREFVKNFAKSATEVMNESDLMYELIHDAIDDKVYQAMRKNMNRIFVRAINDAFGNIK